LKEIVCQIFYTVNFYIHLFNPKFKNYKNKLVFLVNKKCYDIITKILLLAIVGALFLFYSQDASSVPKNHKISHVKSKSKKKKKHHKKKRNYNRSKTRALSINIIRANSEHLSALAGLEPLPSDSGSKLPVITQDDSEQVDPYDDSYEGEQGENIAELEKEDDVPVDIETFKMLWLSYVDGDDKDDDMTAGGIRKKDIMGVIMDWLGTPYHFGGSSKRAIDCSAFVQDVFVEASNLVLPRTARNQFNIGYKVKRGELQFGDLIFFHTYTRRFPSHVGIYLGDDLFAHASSRYGVTVSSLESTYYKNRFIGGRRLSVQDLVRYSKGPTNTTISTQ
jgi:cell wall-associated NlpC family hydrolase